MAWNTLFEGNDYNDNGKRAWSSYVELGYSLKVRKIDVDLTLGFIPYKSEQTYGVDGFAVTNVGAKGTYTVHACSGLDIPIFTKVVVNPKREDAHVILGISLVPTGL